MGKSVYSLVLMDDVVAQIDQMAYAMNTSRSNLINQLLAEAVSYTTPEKRIRSVFDEMVRLLDSRSTFQVQNQPSDAMMSIRSALRFKYNPTIRYSVELFRQNEGAFGRLRVTARTQSRRLLELLEGFYREFIRLEQRYGARYFPEKKLVYQLEDGKFTRNLSAEKPRGDWDEELLAQAIIDYITMVDGAMKAYFEHPDDSGAGRAEMEEIYRSYLKNLKILI